MHQRIKDKIMTATEVAELIQDDEIIAASGFTAAGSLKVIPKAIAAKAKKLHDEGHPFRINLYTGASTSDEFDGELARSHAIKSRLPYQSNQDLRKQINDGMVDFSDFHLSKVPFFVRNGYLRPPHTAIIEAVDVSEDGKVYLSMAGGASASYMMKAKRIFIELNQYFGESLKGFHDVYIPDDQPYRRAIIPIYTASDRIGAPFVKIDFDKIAGIVLTNQPDQSEPFREPDEDCRAIACHIIDFLKNERKKGRMPTQLPIQSGVGNIANAVLACFAEDPEFEPISLYTEVVQDSVFKLIDQQKLLIASTCALSFSPEGQRRFKDNIDQFRSLFLIRQQDITNSPEVIHRLGLISMNTAIEVDIFGNVNSTHLFGSRMMNGIGGSADFTRNCFLPIFMTPSMSKGGMISHVMPFVSHTDQSEHSTQIFVTEQGLADLRGLSPLARAREIIHRCAHPSYREALTDILDYGIQHAPSKHIPIALDRAFEFHSRYLKYGSMLPQ